MGSWACRARSAARMALCALAVGGCGFASRPNERASTVESARTTSTELGGRLEQRRRREVGRSKRGAQDPPDSRLAKDLALPPMPRAGEQLLDGDVRVDVYPPLDEDTARAPLVAYLHGACGDPGDCAFIQGAGRANSFLACAAGNARCGDGFDWVGPTEARTATVEAELAAVDRALGARVEHDQGDVLIGYSRGAYLARDLLAARPGIFRGVVYIGAFIKPDAAALRAAGIKRVVLACGDYDRRLEADAEHRREA